ncbi:MAG TPA: DUF3231 family protein [Pseudogracilibacillus sp.]|nr:DUF3231 family protein [Pseudogracilibacillus sp.]
MPSVGSIFKNAVDVIGSLTDNHKDPMHVGETMACWTYYTFVSQIISHEEIGLNTTTDSKLTKLYQDAYKVTTSHKNELSELMRQEGIPLSDASATKPESNPEAIPLGAKFTDSELINTLNINFVIAADMCATAASQSLRTDISLIFLKFQTDKLSLGLKAKEIMRSKGWLKVPPAYYPPGATQNKST